jgi:hypothetical protein
MNWRRRAARKRKLWHFRTLEDELAKLEANSIPIPFSGCRIWLGATNGEYPMANILGKNMLVHRFVCEQTHGPIPTGHFAIHSCDVPCCIAPEHIRPGTHADNMRDATIRKRWRRQRRMRV